MKKLIFLIALVSNSFFFITAQDNEFDVIYNYYDSNQYENALNYINSQLHKSTFTKEETNSLLYNKGYTFEILGPLDSAIWCYEKVLHSDSLHIPSLNALGMLYGDFELYTEAYKLFYRLLEIDSTLVLPYSNLVYYKGLEGNFKEAVEIATDALLLTKDTVTSALLLNNLSYAQYHLDLTEEAYLSVTESIDLLPNNAYAYRNLGLIYIQRKEKTDACISFQKSEELGGTENSKSLLEEYCK